MSSSTSTAGWWWEHSTCRCVFQRWGPCAKPPRGRGLGNHPYRRGFLLQGELPGWQVSGCTSTTIFAIQTNSKCWESLALPQHREGKELSPWQLQAWKRLPPEAIQLNEKLQLPIQKGKASFPHPFFWYYYPTSKKIFWHNQFTYLQFWNKTSSQHTIQTLLGTNSTFTDTHTTVENLVIRNARKIGHTSQDYFSDLFLFCFLTPSDAFLSIPSP